MLNTTLILKLLGDSMKSLFGLKNMIMFSAVLLTIGSVSTQQAFAGMPVLNCISAGDGNWNNSSNWSSCDGGIPDDNKNAAIQSGKNIVITGDEKAKILTVSESGTLFIDCDASLNLFVSGGFVTGNSNITNHGTFTSVPSFSLFGASNFFNSGDFSGVTTSEGGSIVEISSICDRPIGGTVGSMSTTSLLVAGAQTNMGLWSLALVGMVAAGAAITYKVKSHKTEE